MPGTRTAPLIDGTPGFVKVSLRWMDFTSDIRTDSYQFVTAQATPIAIEAFAEAAQALSNATLYEVAVSDVYSSVPDGTTNALEEVWENVKDNLVIQTKNTQNKSIRGFIPSPVNSLFLDGTEDIDPANAALGTFLTAFTALILTGYVVVGARFTHRKQINQQIKF